MADHSAGHHLVGLAKDFLIPFAWSCLQASQGFNKPRRQRGPGGGLSVASAAKKERCGQFKSEEEKKEEKIHLC